MATASVETVRILQVTCENVYEAAAFNKLWAYLKEQNGYTVAALIQSIHPHTGAHLESLIKVQPQNGPIRSRLARTDTYYSREKEWKLEITITNSSVDDCNIILPKPPTKKQR
jgi:hypothetical protein